ncbi:MAG: L,D-transpeptidase [Alphaproteobacteria bacterium]
MSARIINRPRSRRLFCVAALGALVAVSGCTASNMTKDGEPIDPLVVAMYAPVEGEPFRVPAVPIAKVDPKLYRQTVTTPPTISAEPGTIVVDPYEKFLYLVQEGGQSIRYGIGVGKQGFAWSGTAEIHDKQHWPKWFPPQEMQERDEYAAQFPDGMDGGPKNPLGSRAVYLYEGECNANNLRTPSCRDTLYRIHATNEPLSIGKAVSSGCIRMWNQDGIDLYDRVALGTKVVVLSTGAPQPIEDPAIVGPPIAGAPLLSGDPIVVALPASPAI